jgi:hypothetical protein
MPDVRRGQGSKTELNLFDRLCLRADERLTLGLYQGLLAAAPADDKTFLRPASGIRSGLRVALIRLAGSGLARGSGLALLAARMLPRRRFTLAAAVAAARRAAALAVAAAG